MREITAFENSKAIRQQIKSNIIELNSGEIGRIIKTGDGIAAIYGLENVMAGELLALPDNVAGIALNLAEDKVGAVLFGDYQKIGEGDIVRRTRNLMSVPVGEIMLGRVVNALGQPIDGLGPIISD